MFNYAANKIDAKNILHVKFMFRSSLRKHNLTFHFDRLTETTRRHCGPRPSVVQGKQFSLSTATLRKDLDRNG